MPFVHVLCFVVFLTQVLRRGAVLAGDTECQWVEAAIRRDSCWNVDASKTVLKWYRPKDQTSQMALLSQCVCNPLGLGDFTRIQVTAGKGQKSTSNSLCSGCLGVEVAVTDYSFSPDDPMNGQGSPTFGPCAGITVFRCSCPLPTTTLVPTTTSKAGDPYNP